MSATIQDTDRTRARTLRLSVTGDCNLECFYCKALGHARDLVRTKTPIQASDVSKLVKILGELGVTRVIISGGEPLLRKDIPNFVKSAFAHKAITDVRLATNGTYLKTYADGLRKMGLRKVEINFDSLNYAKYQALTKRDDLFRVLDGIEKVEKLNFPDIRLNVFLLNGINEDEVVEFARMTKEHKLLLRFMEYHPMHGNGADLHSPRLGLPVLVAKRRIDDYQRLIQVHDLTAEHPVPTFRFADGVGHVAFLSKMEVEAERAVPRVVFTADGSLFNEAVPHRPQAILADLRRDAKESRLHRTIEKLLTLGAEEERYKIVKPALRALSRNGRATRSAVARR
ncbi:MAG: radical SAM protein [Pseudomonadota bacterium]